MITLMKTPGHGPLSGTFPSPAFPLVLLFGTARYFCLQISGHRLFDNEQQQVIAEMPLTLIRLYWHTPSGDAVLRVGRSEVALSDRDITVYRFAGRGEPAPQEDDWNTLQYTIFKGGVPDGSDWVFQPFSLSELRCHEEFSRLRCRGAILSGAGGMNL